MPARLDERFPPADVDLLSPPEAVLALQGPHLQFSSGSHWSLSDRTSPFRRKIFSWIFYDIPTPTPSSPWRCREPRNPHESAFSGGKSLILRCRTGGMAVRAETLPSERRNPGIRLGGGAAWGGGRCDPGQGRGVQRRGPARPPRESRRGPSRRGAGRSRGRQVSPPRPPRRSGGGPGRSCLPVRGISRRPRDGSCPVGCWGSTGRCGPRSACGSGPGWRRGRRCRRDARRSSRAPSPPRARSARP